MSDDTEAELVKIEIARAKEQDAEISAWEDDFLRHAMSDELVNRLRDQGKDAFARQYSLGMFKLCDEAADEIERLRAELRHLRIDNARLRDNAVPQRSNPASKWLGNV